MYESEQHENTWSTLDLMFCSTPLIDRLINCDVCGEDRIPHTDHLPVHSSFDVSILKTNRPAGRNYQNVDWDKFGLSLANALNNTLLTTAITPTMNTDLDTYVSHLTTATQTTIELHVPHCKASPYSKRWWTPELKILCKKYSLMDRIAFHSRGTPQEEECMTRCKIARNTYTSAIKKAKTEHWKNWIENVNERDIWTAEKLA
ncbi:hypothetical protein M422DRAFT_181181, partial [Sphaerobolus stellatus SS14]